MSYRMLDLELRRTLPEVALEPHETGIAVVARLDSRLVGFLMQRCTGGTIISSAELGAMIAAHLGKQVVQTRLAVEHRRRQAPAARLPKVSVAICTRNHPELLRRCLTSFLRLEPSVPEAAAGLEILIVDNAPPDERTREAAAEFPGVRYVREPKQGLNFARNCALHAATGSLLCFIDDDVVVDRGWLGGLREAACENPDARAFTGLVLPYALSTPAQILFESRGGFGRGFEKLRYRVERIGNSLFPCGAGMFGAGANMAFSREALLGIGGFDPALDTGAPLPGGGDLDIFYRMLRAGFTLVYEPQMTVFHEHRKSMAELQRQYWTWGLAHMAFVMKSMRADPQNRRRLWRLSWWWYKDQVKRLVRALRGRDVTPPRLVAVELLGGVLGAAGEYGRSQRRAARIMASDA